MTQQLIGGKFSATYPDASTGALKPAVGYKLYTYISGTLTNKTTWSDSALSVPNTNPIVLDARGEASVFLGSGAYTLALKNATGSTIWTRDGVSQAASSADLSGSGGSALVGDIAPSAGSAARTVSARLNDSYNIMNGAGVVGGGVADDTIAMNAYIAALSAEAVAAGKVIHLEFPSTKFLTAGLLVKPNIAFEFNKAYFLKQSNGGTIQTNSLVRAVETFTSSTYYGSYANMSLIGGVFDGNGKTSSANLIRLLYTENLLIEGLTIAAYSPGAFAFGLGGRNGKVRGCSVLGGANLFEDGIHLLHGMYWDISGNHVESGDDAYVCGGEPTDTYLAADPESIRYVTFSNNTVKAQKAVGFKCYVKSGATGANWEVSDIVVKGLTGETGITRNGGISLQDENGTAYGTSQINRIKIDGLSLKVGSSAHDDTTPVGAQILSCGDVSVRGTIEMISGSGAATGFRVARAYKSQNVDMEINCASVPKNGGVAFDTSKSCTLRNSNITGSSAQGLPSLLLIDAEDFRATGNRLTNVKSGQNVIGTSGGTLTYGQIANNTLGHATGAVTGNGINLSAAATATYLEISGNDTRSCFNAISSNVSSITGYNIHDNEGLSTQVRGTSSIAAGNVTVTVTHGADVGGVSVTQANVMPIGSWGSATKWWVTNIDANSFAINCDIAPGGGGFGFAWSIDTGKKPIT